jgi:hypothetical protein
MGLLGSTGGIDLSSLSESQAAQAHNLLEQADIAKKAGMLRVAERLRAQVQIMVRREQKSDSRLPSKREKIKNRQWQIRTAKTQKR